MERLSRNAFRTTFMLLMLVFGVVTVTAQSLKSIKGVVVDKENNSVIGASVLQKGTNNGVVTDLDGNFTLTMQDDAPKVIIISYLGMKSQEISVTKANLGQITLVEDAEMLDEVVVVSYGKQSKRLITGSVQSVKATELADMPVAQLSQKLQGKLAGVQINQVTGIPGQGMEIRIRGQASISAGSDPLIVVDGFPINSSLANINPDEIETISVLKDASASSLYGSRAANGVVLITTKRAKAGSSSLSVSAYMGLQQIPNELKPDMMNAREFAQFKKDDDETYLLIISLYEPIIGPIAVSLYLTLWADLDKLEIMSKDFTHHHLMTILKTKLVDIENARKSLEAVGLLKSYIKRNDNINEYLYELYSPLSASEFLNHPVLSVLLLNNIGENEYNIILNNYKRHTFSKGDYEEITSSMNETFKSVNESVYEENIRSVKKLGVNIESSIDFELLESTLPKGLVTSKTFNKKTRDLINQLAFIYNIDSIKMSEIIRLVIDEYGIINKDKLRISTRKNYEYNNNGSLPTIVYRTQPEYLKSPSGDLSNRGKMIHVFENTKPYDFLKSKNRGIKPTSRDLKLLEHLAVDFDLPPGVINVLVDYALLVNNGKLNSAYLETIAGDWSRRNVKTVEDAMSIAEKGHKKNVKVVKEITKKDVVNVPAWMDKDNKSEKMSEEELAELESMFEEFR